MACFFCLFIGTCQLFIIFELEKKLLLFVMSYEKALCFFKCYIVYLWLIIKKIKLIYGDN